MKSSTRTRLVNVFIMLLDLTLLIGFSIQAFLAGCIAIYGYIPLPNSFCSQLIQKQIPSEYRISVSEYRIRSVKSIDLIDLEIHAQHIEQDLFKAELAEINLSWKGLFNFPELVSFVLSEGTLSVPAVYSPNGQHTPLLERIALRIVPDDSFFSVDRFAALHDDIRLRGMFDIPKPKAESKSEKSIPEGEDPLGLFYSKVSTIIAQKDQISLFEKPTIAFRIDSLSQGELGIIFRISSRNYNSPLIKASNVELNAKLHSKGNNLAPIDPPYLKAQSLSIPEKQLSITDLTAQLDPTDLEALLNEEWPTFKIAAHHIGLSEYELNAPILVVDTAKLPQLSFSGAAQSLNSAIKIGGTVDTNTLAARVHVRGSIDLAKIASEDLLNAIPSIEYEDAPYYDLSLSLAPGFSILNARLRAQVENARIGGLLFNHIEAEAQYTEGFYTIENLYLRRGLQWLDTALVFDTDTADYQLSLIGSAVPTDYNRLLPRWWGRIFSDLDFNQTRYSHADFIVYGNAKRGQTDLLFGRVEARNVIYSGVHLDEGQLLVRGRDHYTELHDLDVTSGDGWARGDIRFVSSPDPIPGPVSVHINLDAKLSIVNAASLFEGSIADTINYFTTDALPTLQLDGVIFNDAYPDYKGKDYFNVFGQCPAPITLKGVPFDYLNFELYGRSGKTHLRELDFGYANGAGEALIDIHHPNEVESTVRYKISLLDADQNQAVRDLPHLDELEDSIETQPEVVSSPTKREESRVDISLHGEGPANDAFIHKGFGAIDVRSEKLWTIQLLGPLSKLLQRTYLSFTSFNLNTLSGNFAYENNKVHFDDLQIDGPVTKIESRGSITLSDQVLNFRVSVFLFGNAGNPDSRLRRIGDFIKRPLPNLLEFEVTGTVEKQKIRSLYDPRKLIPLL